MTQDNNAGDQPPPEPPKRGSMRFQDAENTRARQPSVAEQRARQQALAQEERDEELARQADAKAATRRKILIGSGVTVGLVGLVATFYTVAKPNNVTAVCTDSGGVVQNDDYCDDNYVTSHGGYHSGGFLFLPIGGGGYNSYRYNYGGSGTIGQRVSGGSYDPPSSRTNVNTKSGKSVQRGGFGISGKSGTTGGSGGSGKSGGS
ncbi:cell envelope integrity protein TolA [Amycolatopsis sp. NPDC051128]|uniref:cell envelope integrity protein TolA n=1 Tax=Amycolatopsis sp. NPDC051128 TaxID=3155412 RepID=UPI00341DF65D